eukprot:CAMPEP_0201565154 /NCGR_PEP_ID=MMETSP0190_2-20130828/4046_1 /ASSEMBLY_ACC=CAM_ASM_000263 /TAXON_ID=37353 /ORGANISM="Rosalina sp." /LENGTH=525 /DNA_ID=CAMNT_0047982299 /DNA_START=52 /DNA_END=1629 /DNA_ORIENTATION=-
MNSIIVFLGYLTVSTLSKRLLQQLPSGSTTCAATTCPTGFGCIDGVGCIFGGSTCLGIANLQCPSPTIQSCIVDTTICDPAGSGRDCGGICVEECTIASDCSNAPDAECTTATIGTTDYGICTPSASPTSCGVNEVYRQCGSSCPDNCDDRDRACISMCDEGCFCKDGYILDVADGECIPEDECPTVEPFTTDDVTVCGENEVFDGCGTACPKKCGDPDIVACTKQCVPGCFCDIESGYVLTEEDGECILETECPTEEPIILTTEECGENEVYDSCGTACPKKCGDSGFGPCVLSCNPGCFCKPGYVLDEEDGECIPEDECVSTTADPTECGENEEYQTCGTACPAICGDDAFGPCTMQCVTGCFCKTGYILDEEDGECISDDECFDIDTTSSTEEEATDISTTDEEDGECPSDTAVALYFLWYWNPIQRACDVCLSETRGTARSERRCDRIENILDGIVDEFSTCVLGICDYGCAVGDLVVSSTAGDQEYCGCDTFECGTLGSDVSSYGLMMVIGAICIAFGWM